jgi:hypothetical protein
MESSGMLRRVDLVRTDVSEELSASIIRVTRIGELGITLAVTSNRLRLRRNKKSRCRSHALLNQWVAGTSIRPTRENVIFVIYKHKTTISVASSSRAKYTD